MLGIRSRRCSNVFYIIVDIDWNTANKAHGMRRLGDYIFRNLSAKHATQFNQRYLHGKYYLLLEASACD